jgi:hypothetical protein
VKALPKTVQPALGGSGIAPSRQSCNKGVPGRILTMLVSSALAALLVTIIPSAFAADEKGASGSGYVEIGGGYTTGDFGTTTRSNLFYFAPTLGYVSRSWDVGVTLPYLAQSNKTKDPTGATSATSSTANGVGDVIVRGGGVLVPEREFGFSLDGGLALKLPTASGSNGLGTGETDYGASAGMHQRIGRFKVSAFAGYIKVGDPTGLNYNNSPSYGGGVSGIFGKTNVSAWFEARRSIIPGAKNPQEIYFSLFHVLRRKVALKGGTFFGLNKGGPDFGLNISIVRWF